MLATIHRLNLKLMVQFQTKRWWSHYQHSKTIATGEFTSSMHKKKSTSTHKIRKRLKVVSVSEFHKQKLQVYQRIYLQSLSMNFHEQILDTPIEQISFLKECAEEIITEITRTDPTNGLPLKNSLIELFTKTETWYFDIFIIGKDE